MEERKRLAENLAWQIGSSKPPTVCLCCGSRFDEGEHKIRGPYLSSPYLWVCQWCWKKDYLFFPDKQGYFQQTFTDATPSETKAQGRRTVSLKLATGRTLNCVLKPIPLDRIQLDVKNTRLKHIKGNLSENQVEDLIWRQPSTRVLSRQIESAAGLTNQPLIDSKYVVREGNRRIVCLRKLKEQILKGQSHIPLWSIDPVLCFVLPTDATEADVAIYVALEHVSGKRKWAAIDQAEHVYELVTQHKLKEEKIEQTIGLNKSSIDWTVFAYKKTNEYHLAYPEDNEWANKYSYFYEIAKKPKLKEWLSSSQNLERLITWIRRGQISRGEEIRKLPEVLAHKELMQKIERGAPFGNIFMQKQRASKKPKPNDETKKALKEARVAIARIRKSRRSGRQVDRMTTKAAKELYSELTSFFD
jgi:hypothetical protein